jgi:hypothetical protein
VPKRRNGISSLSLCGKIMKVPVDNSYDSKTGYTRRKNMKHLVLIVGLFSVVFASGLITTTIQAQPYPNRNIRLIIPTTPGAGMDITGRLVDLSPLTLNFF